MTRLGGPVSGVAKIIEAFFCRKVVEGDSDGFPEGTDGSAAYLAQCVFQLGVGLFSGFRSGLPEGKKRNAAPVASMAVRAPASLWEAKLSVITISPGGKLGASTARHRRETSRH